MPTIFDSIKVSAPKVNSFDLSHSVKMTCNSGYLIPFVCRPVVPGDTFRFKPEVFCRAAPMVAPAFADVDIRVETFYVPNRLLWRNFDDFIRMEKDSTVEKPIRPYINIADMKRLGDEGNINFVGAGSLADYLGIPVQMFNGDFNESAIVSSKNDEGNISALPFAAVQACYRDWYQAEDVMNQEAIFDELHDGDNVDNIFKLCWLHHRCYKKDYFTSALPNAQRGNDVTIPVTGGDVGISHTPGHISTLYNVNSGTSLERGATLKVSDESNPSGVSSTDILGRTAGVDIDNSQSLSGSINSLEATITDLRTAFSVQRALELSMRAGKRLKEQIYAFFGVKVPDDRLDRVEYLGGGKIPIMIGEVPQTSATDSVSPQGNLAGRATAAGDFFMDKKYFPEHGWFIAFISIVPKAQYFQGLERYWKLDDMMDYYWPQFQHIGEQSILNRELLWDPTGFYSGNSNLGTFGYAPRYSEYKWIPSQIRGEFRTNLVHWHAGRLFGAPPRLNGTFLEVGQTNVNRMFAVTDRNYHHFYLDIWCDLKALRPMDYFGSPL